jgi:pyrroloquinoline quinone (PQQ) biosynthesis protein C
MNESILDELKQHPNRLLVAHHPFFKEVRSRQLSAQDVQLFLGQYWYPMHYFPTFLSRLISVTPSAPIQTVISRILWQELGEGTYETSHEQLYVDTMEKAGFPRATIVDVPQLDSTKQLVEGYASASHNYLAALGWLWGTETNDLTIVTGLGKAVSLHSKSKSLPWVEIHAKQEPQHVEDATEVVMFQLTAAERAQVVEAACDTWQRWANFFGELQAGLTSSPERRVG